MASQQSTTHVERPIVILGAPRSGTTMLATMLGNHPDCVRAREARLVWRYGNDRRSDELEPEHLTPKIVEHIHARFGELVSAGGGGRLIEKTPSNSVRPWFVDRVFPGAYYVHITRAGWGCVPSIRDFWLGRSTGLDAKQRAKARRRLSEISLSQVPHYAGELVKRAIPVGSRRQPLYGPRISGLETITGDLGVLQASALQWQRCVTRSTAFGREVGDARYLEVKLEQLDPDAFRGILSFCELGADEAVVAAFADGYDPAAATRQRALEPDERRSVAPMIEPIDAWLGYTPAAVG